MYFNSLGNGNNANNRNNLNSIYNFSNGYNNQKSNQQQSPNEQKPNTAGSFIMILLILTGVIMIFHVIDVVNTNNKLQEDNTSEKETDSQDNNIEENNNKNDNVDDNSENEQKTEEKNPTVEEQNKDELTKLCKLIDSEGAYKYDEYIEYIDSFDASDLTKEEQYEIMSKKNYCYNGACVKIEKAGIINYVECETGKFSRITFDEYQELQEEQAKVNINLHTACLNVDADGNYDSGAATGIRVKCENYICSLDYEGEKITKNCKE